MAVLEQLILVNTTVWHRMYGIHFIRTWINFRKDSTAFKLEEFDSQIGFRIRCAMMKLLKWT